MKLSVKSDYAARAVLGLARHYPNGEALRVEDLASDQHIPANYLVQILIELKAQALVIGTDGFFTSRIKLLAELTHRHALPTISSYREFPMAGGLISYGNQRC